MSSRSRREDRPAKDNDLGARAQVERVRRGAGPTRKTESLTVRLDPKSKFGLELMARAQNRSVTGVVEWALRFAMTAAELSDGSPLASLVDEVWTVDEPMRLVLLATRAPGMLTYEERRIWETMLASEGFWMGRYADRAEDIDIAALRGMWVALRNHVLDHENEPAIVPFDGWMPLGGPDRR